MDFKKWLTNEASNIGNDNRFIIKRWRGSIYDAMNAVRTLPPQYRKEGDALIQKIRNCRMDGDDDMTEIADTAGILCDYLDDHAPNGCPISVRQFQEIIPKFKRDEKVIWDGKPGRIKSAHAAWPNVIYWVKGDDRSWSNFVHEKELQASNN